MIERERERERERDFQILFESLTVVCRFVETVIFPELGPNNVKKVKKRTFRERKRDRER